ncbi:SLC13 family permease [Tropicimonas isoalkanivorans]|uniref:Di-and tricarboxylate transporter n=1 Tax=Tropicimonas isoalkanivorans TaxID=441112 RepID=A0A1I1LJ94_9RHOB|nr:SLC13 family permease [Tropicimonas isoalkanivorans]SFC73174.1 Di-and tricarboxylate transporter [Tropicimonas isoalkanivorans]
MTADQIILFCLFGTVFALLLWGRLRYDLIAFSALMAAVVLGVLTPEEAFAGFGHPATLVVALVLVVSAGLVRSGAIYLITRTLVDSSRSLGAHIAFMGAIGGALSAFMNNVAALALLMPVDVQTARKAGRSARLSLMPLSFCTILGGMVTLIGTPPNIVIATIRRDQLGESFGMFDFAPVGAVVAVAGLFFVAIVGWRLIPRATGAGALAEARERVKDYIAELKIPTDSDLIGKRLFEFYETAEKNDVAILGLTRAGKRRYGMQRNTVLEEGDALVIEARPEALDEFRAALALEFTDSDEAEHLGIAGEGMSIVEAVVPEGARIVGKTARSLNLARGQRTVLLGISRRGRGITKEVRQTVVRAGDILLLLTPEGDDDVVTDWLGVLPLAGRGLVVTDFRKVWLAIGIFAAAVAAASFGLLYLPVALGIVIIAYVLTGILPLADIYTHIEWPVVVLLGSMIPLGAALDNAGGTALIANAIVGFTAGWPAWGVLTVLMVVTMSLSDVLNNTATAVVAAPVGIQVAQGLGTNPDPFLMAVAVAASCAFLTPIGHKNNTLILGPGGYAFGDYWRMGLPLEILVVAVAVPMILLVWPL